LLAVNEITDGYLTPVSPRTKNKKVGWCRDVSRAKPNIYSDKLKLLIALSAMTKLDIKPIELQDI